MKQLSLLSFVCGTLIVLAPIVQNIISMAMITHLMAINPKGEFHLNSSLLSNSYQSWCLCIGIGLFVVGVVSGFRSSGERASVYFPADVSPRFSSPTSA